MAATTKHMQPMFCIITGASQGFGQAIAIALAEKASPKSCFLLIARSAEGLDRTKSTIQKVCSDKQICVVSVCKDLSIQDGKFRDIVKSSLTVSGCSAKEFSKAMIVHNAGSLGDTSKYLSEFTEPDEVSEYFDFNVSSLVCLTSTFLQLFPRKIEEHAIKRIIVNVSSLCALEPFPSLGLYCSGKAARDMMFQVLAVEQPDVRVLNYAPGPLKGNMQQTLRHMTKNEELKAQFQSLFESKKLVEPCDSANKMVEILEQNTFVSGQHIDYFDELT